jgi:hypothetical protein
LIYSGGRRNGADLRSWIYQGALNYRHNNHRTGRHDVELSPRVLPDSPGTGRLCRYRKCNLICAQHQSRCIEVSTTSPLGHVHCHLRHRSWFVLHVFHPSFPPIFSLTGHTCRWDNLPHHILETPAQARLPVGHSSSRFRDAGGINHRDGNHIAQHQEQGSP